MCEFCETNETGKDECEGQSTHQHGHNGNGHHGQKGSNGHNGNRPTREISAVDFDLPSVAGGQVVRGHNILTFNTAPAEEYNPLHTGIYPATEVLTGDAEQYSKIRKAIFDLLDAFNVNWDDPNYTETPDRVAKAYLNFWASGYGRDPEDEITLFPNTSDSGDLVMVKDMQFYSLCSHHLAPFKGYGAIAYVPNGHLLGLSKLGRILDIYARRFQLQERIGAQVADKIMELIHPQGVMVVLYDVEHMCMSSRGVKLHEANTTTMTTRGVFKDNSQLRMEVLSLLKS
jgi:GTP cyclohydrolase I